MQKTARQFCAIRQFYKKSVKTAAKICIKLLNGKTRSVNIILIPLIFIVLNGSSSSGGSSTTAPTVDGKETTWTDIASDIAKLTEGKNATIELNGATSVPADVIKAIASSNAEVTLKVDDVFSWTINGADIDENGTASGLDVSEKGVNPLVADFNGDGFINAKDALAILKKYLGID